MGAARKVRGTGSQVDLGALDAMLGDDDAMVDLSSIDVMLRDAAKVVRRDADYQSYAQGGEAAGWLADQMKYTTQEPGRIPAAVCEAAGCRCPVGPSGKTVHMGWVRRPVVKVITKYAG